MSERIEETGLIYVNEQIGPDLFVMEIGAPKIASLVRPGQFVHAIIPGMEAHILRRPFSVYSAVPEIGLIEILYQGVGFGTKKMQELKMQDKLELIGPLGTGWNPLESATRALMVAGGVGAAPLYMLSNKLASQGVTIDVVMGARSKSSLVCHERYTSLFDENGLSLEGLRCATDDGSFGHAGFNTDLVKEALATNSYDYAAVCGPEPMIERVVSMLNEASIPCEISLERRMACGVGACLSCVVQTSEGMKRACFDGPVFDAKKVMFDEC
ncbi:MAG: dihydroorotate dehydrogenase electron transfer subunit [Raoultibacter sp.]|jgi:dihydroorotate dehydrogenase electron transfer subunit